MPLSRFLAFGFRASIANDGGALGRAVHGEYGEASVKLSRFRTGAAATALGLLGWTGAWAPVEAHHSFAPYEPDRQITFTGKVTDFQWTNPHVYIEMEAPDDKGEMRRWLIECANTSILNRTGWKWNMIKAGDEIDVIVAPLRNGEPAALLKSVRLADGRVFSNGGPAGRASISFED